jgi:hypothetical protein
VTSGACQIIEAVVDTFFSLNQVPLRLKESDHPDAEMFCQT